MGAESETGEEETCRDKEEEMRVVEATYKEEEEEEEVCRHMEVVVKVMGAEETCSDTEDASHALEVVVTWEEGI